MTAFHHYVLVFFTLDMKTKIAIFMVKKETDSHSTHNKFLYSFKNSKTNKALC